MTRLQELITIVKQDMVNAQIPFDENVPIEPNKRLRRLAGRCRYKKVLYGYKAFVVEINANMLKTESDEFLKNVICHELLHSAPECVRSGHGGNWKRYARLMNIRNHNYNITRCYSKEDLSKDYKNSYKYKVVCEDCGKTYYYNKKGKVVSTVMDGYHFYRCGKCDSDNLKVIKL